MELKGLEKGHPRSTPITPSTRGSMDFEDSEEKVPLQHNTNSLDKGNYLKSYAGKDFTTKTKGAVFSCHRRFVLHDYDFLYFINFLSCVTLAPQPHHLACIPKRVLILVQ
jgi:hypothetical protein